MWLVYHFFSQNDERMDWIGTKRPEQRQVGEENFKGRINEEILMKDYKDQSIMPVFKGIV